MYLKQATLLEYIFAVVLHLQFMLQVITIPMLNILGFDIRVLYEVFVRCLIWLFLFLQFFYFILSFRLLRHFLNYLEVDPVAFIITGTTFVFTFHIRCISIVRCSVHLKSSPFDKSLGAQRWRKVQLYQFITSGRDVGGWSKPRPRNFTPRKQKRCPYYKRLKRFQGMSG